MELDFKLIKNYSNEKLFDYLFPLSENIKKELNYIQIDENILNDIIINVIKENLSRVKHIERVKRKDFILRLIKDKIKIYSFLKKVNVQMIKTLDLNKLSNDNSKELKKNNLSYYLEKINNFLLTPKEEKEFLKQIKLGNKEAKDFFIERNLRLVVKISKNYLGCGLDWEELIQEGTIGLIEAIDKFDIKKDVRFSTYATYWIKQRIKRSIDEYARTIKLSSNLLIQIEKYRKLKEYIENNYDINLSIELLCKSLKISSNIALKVYYMEEDVLHFEDIFNNAKLVKKYKCGFMSSF